MIHMAFSGAVAFVLIRVLKVVSPIKMTLNIYATCVVPISAFFAASLWFGNTAYLYISVAFIQMLKALMPVATFLVAVICGTEKLRCDVFWNMVLVSVGVVISSYGEIHFNVIALGGVVLYNYLKVKDVRTSQLQSIQDESAKELQTEKKADDVLNSNEDDLVSDTHLDEEAPLISSSRMSHLGRKPA
ncbi:Sugar phosphate transporter domain [Sesbania bispinosa]|nr:Sugar phosphate transporter domain [Sesbania bispinosa]